MRKKAAIVLGHAVPYPFDKTGGIEKVFMGIFKALEEEGFEFTLIARAPDHSISQVQMQSSKNLQLIKGYTWSKNKVLNVWNALLWCIRVQKYLRGQDLVLYNSVFGPFSHFLYGQKSVCTYCDQRGVSKIKNILIKGFMVQRIYCISEFVKGTWPVGLHSKCRVIHNGVDTSSFAYIPALPVRGQLKLLFVGRIVEEKGLVLLIEALGIALREYRVNCKLVVIGPWETRQGGSEQYYAQCVSKVSGLQLHDVIEFAGEKKSAEIIQYMQASDLFICSSIWEEAFGIVNIEALSCGVPVIGFSTGALPEIISSGVNGFLAKEKTPQALASAINSYFALKDEVKREMKKNARVSSQKYDFKKIAIDYSEDFADLCNNKIS